MLWRAAQLPSATVLLAAFIANAAVPASKSYLRHEMARTARRSIGTKSLANSMGLAKSSGRIE
jgi:hypothetical protein